MSSELTTFQGQIESLFQLSGSIDYGMEALGTGQFVPPLARPFAQLTHSLAPEPSWNKIYIRPSMSLMRGFQKLSAHLAFSTQVTGTKAEPGIDRKPSITSAL